jgi:hypothetical protein
VVQIEPECGTYKLGDTLVLFLCEVLHRGFEWRRKRNRDGFSLWDRMRLLCDDVTQTSVPCARASTFY